MSDIKRSHRGRWRRWVETHTGTIRRIGFRQAPLIESERTGRTIINPALNCFMAKYGPSEHVRRMAQYACNAGRRWAR